MERVIIDTDVLIDYVRGFEEARKFLENLGAECRWTTVVNVLELFQGALNRFDLRKLDRFIRESFQVFMLTPQSCSMALQLIRRHALSDGLRAGDALVAAVAIENDALPATGNRKHFDRIQDLKFLDARISKSHE